MTINELVIQSFTTAHKNGFWKQARSIPEMLMLIVSELSEALEEHRTNGITEAFSEEIADAFIRLADMCGGLQLDIEPIILKKMEKNKGRPYKHGKLY